MPAARASFASSSTPEYLLLWSAGCTLVALASAAGMTSLFFYAPLGSVALKVGNVWSGLILDAPWTYHLTLAGLFLVLLRRARRPQPTLAWVLPLAVVGVLEIFSLSLAVMHLDDARALKVSNADKVAAARAALAPATTASPPTTVVEPSSRGLQTRSSGMRRGDALSVASDGHRLTVHAAQPECRARVIEAAKALPSAGYRLLSVDAAPPSPAACARRVGNVLVFALAASP